MSGAVRRQGDVDQRRKERRMFLGIEADQLERVFEVGQALPRGRLGVVGLDRILGRVIWCSL